MLWSSLGISHSLGVCGRIRFHPIRLVRVRLFDTAVLFRSGAHRLPVLCKCRGFGTFALRILSHLTSGLDLEAYPAYSSRPDRYRDT
jgi:hypothetical protein